MSVSKRRGFTLIELMIVIVVIGVLAAMMMLASTEAVTSAKATKIISDMKQLRTAATAWYLDNYQRITWTANDGAHVKTDDGKTPKLHELLNGKNSEITKYFSNGFAINNGKTNYASNNKNEFFADVGGYAIYLGKKNTVCYVVYKISENNDASEETRLKQKLKGRAKLSGLLSYQYGSPSKSFAYNGIDANVFMEVFRLEK